MLCKAINSWKKWHIKKSTYLIKLCSLWADREKARSEQVWEEKGGLVSKDAELGIEFRSEPALSPKERYFPRAHLTDSQFFPSLTASVGWAGMLWEQVFLPVQMSQPESWGWGM